jgi:predicted transcriptional regulator
MTETSNAISPTELATELTAAWLSNPNTRADAGDAASFLLRMKQEITGMEGTVSDVDAPAAEAERHEGAVSVRKSLASKDHIVSMIDGKPYKTLRRHLSTHGLTPESYRERYSLKPDYPMVAESYSQARREMAKKIGLGTKANPRKGRQKG